MGNKDTDSTKDLGTLLQSVFQQKNWKDRIGQHQVFLFWNTIVGSEISIRAQPDIIRDNILWVGVIDSVWMQQLQFEKHTLLQQINNELQKKITHHNKTVTTVRLINDIKFKLAPNLNVTEHSVLPKKLEGQSKPIDNSRYEAFERSLNSIENERIKESLRKLWITHEQRKT